MYSSVYTLISFHISHRRANKMLKVNLSEHEEAAVG